jgi:hypothetical protein
VRFSFLYSYSCVFNDSILVFLYFEAKDKHIL